MQKLYEYQQVFEQVRQQLSPDYFSTQELREQIKKTEKEIQVIFTGIKKHQKMIQQRKRNTLNPILIHSQVKRKSQIVREIFSNQQQSQDKGKQNSKDQFKIPKTHQNLIGIDLKRVMKKNMKMEIQIHYQKFHQIKSFQGSQIKKIQSFQVHMHHADKKSSSKVMIFDRSNNIHSRVTTEIVRHERQFFTKVSHNFSQSTFDLTVSLLEQSRIHLFLQSKNKVILGEAKLQFNDLFSQTKTRQDQQIDYSKNSLKTFAIQFYEPQTKSVKKNSQKKLIGIFDVYICVKYQVLPTQINIVSETNQQKKKSLKQIYNQQKLGNSSIKNSKTKKKNQHSPRKIIQNNNISAKSRSPSPIAKKRYLKQLFYQNQQFYIKVINKSFLRVQISWDFDVYSDIQPVYQKSQNIKAKQIHVIKVKQTWVLQILVQLQKEENEGFLVFNLQKKAKYELKILKNRIFKLVAEQEARRNFKSLHENCLIEIGERMLIYPNENVRILRNPISQKVQRGCYSVHFLKSQLSQISVDVFPNDVEFQIVKKQGGFMIYYKIFRRGATQTVAFAVRGSGSSFIDVNIIECEIQQPVLKHTAVKQIYVNVLSYQNADVEQTQQKWDKLDKFYKIDMSGIAKAGNRTRIRVQKRYEQILRVVNGQNFIYRSVESIRILPEHQKAQVQVQQNLILQLCRNIQEQQIVHLFVDDIVKKMTIVVVVKIHPKFSDIVEQQGPQSPFKQLIIKEKKEIFTINF